MQWGNNKVAQVRGKTPTNGPPLMVSAQPPGVFAFADDSWKITFGASRDAIMSILRGDKIKTNMDGVSNKLKFAPFNATPTVRDLNLYEEADGQQQIQYVASKNNVEDASNAKKFGGVEEARSIGMRMPLYAAGWGKTITMRPTDPDPENSRLNDDEHRLDRSTWKEGPVDLRWDSERGLWRAWNDLIADHSTGPFAGSSLGTFVHGTCTDTARGYPFQRGRLEDVWWVRTTQQSTPAQANNDDKTKTAEILTTMKHKLYDTGRNGAGPLWDVFICHQGNGITCGDETTLVGSTSGSPPVDGVEGPGASQGTLEIRTVASFHYSDNLHGPIHFTSLGAEDNEDIGKMKFVEGQWCPVTKFNFNNVQQLCPNPLYTTHMTTLTNNSKEVAEEGVFDLQRMICMWNQGYTECILKHFAWVASNAGSAVWALNHLIPPYILSIVNSITTNILQVLQQSLSSILSSVGAALNSIAAQIESCLNEIVICNIEVPGIAPPVFSVPNVEVPELFIPGFDPPGCVIKSFQSWQFENDEELKIQLINPCGVNPSLRASCANFGTGPIDVDGDGDTEEGLPQPEGGKDFGGTDGEGNTNIGGNSFTNPANEGGDPSGQSPPGSN